MADLNHKRMQIKVLYSFNSLPTVFLSRSKQTYLVKVAQIHNPMATTEQDELITLGAVELKTCIQQIINNSPENFHLTTEDYAVYYKDLTEQPDEPFVSNGVLSSLITSSKTHLIPGRVCQNLSASFLFGDNSNNSNSSLTLEIRLKLHTIDQAPQIHKNQPLQEKRQIEHQHQQQQHHHQQHHHQHHPQQQQPNRQAYGQKKMKSSQSMSSAIKATRTKSLPIFSHIPSQSMFNIMNHDKLNKPSKYDSSSVKDRFKSAPFLQPKILDNPAKRNRRTSDAMSAIRTRSMTTQIPLISSPIQEEALSDSTDDADYRIGEENENDNENTSNIDEDENNQENIDNDDDIDTVFEETSPYTPQQPPYKPTHSHQTFDITNKSSSSSSSFQALPDFEDLDSKRTHTINHTKLPKNHGLLCVNPNCATIESITWRYFETGFHPNYFEIHRAQRFDKKHYDGMFGPLCNACFLFLRNKGFMRPEGVVKKYLQQQKYKQELKKKEEANAAAIESCSSGNTNYNNNKVNNENSNTNGFSSNIQYNKPSANVRLDSDKAESSNYNECRSLSAIAAKKSNKFASSPNVPSQFHKFPTPTHTPSAINQAIQNQKSNTQSSNINANHSDALSTPNFNEINDFMNQLHNYGGPLTDIDPLPQDQPSGITPPMMAEKSNTRVINIYDDGDDKENYPPPQSPDIEDFESMLVKSFATSEKSSPAFHQDWVNSLFTTEPTPTDGHFTPQDSKSTNDVELPQMKAFINEKLTPLDNGLDMKNATVRNMPSSPVITSEINENSDSYVEKRKPTSSSPGGDATRNDTTNSLMSWAQNNESNNKQGSTPNSEFMNHDDSILDKESTTNFNTNEKSEKI